MSTLPEVQPYFQFSNTDLRELSAAGGGSVISIIARARIRTQALAAAAAQRAQAEQLRLAGATSDQDRKPPLVDLKWLAGIPAHVRTLETYAFHAEATQHAMERGAFFSDHVIIRPLRIDLGFELSNFDYQTALDSFSKMEELFRAREPLRLQTTHRTYDGMVLVNLQVENSAPLWGNLVCSASFQQVRVVDLTRLAYTPQQTTPIIAEGVRTTPGGSDVAGTSANGANPTTQKGQQMAVIPPELEYGVVTNRDDMLNSVVTYLIANPSVP